MPQIPKQLGGRVEADMPQIPKQLGGRVEAGMPQIPKQLGGEGGGGHAPDPQATGGEGGGGHVPDPQTVCAPSPCVFNDLVPLGKLLPLKLPEPAGNTDLYMLVRGYSMLQIMNTTNPLGEH